MLWKKESNRPDALYVDMFASCKTYLEDEVRGMKRRYTKPIPQKDNEIALANRNIGNVKFRSGKWTHAMECYNDSLRFAKPASEHISLAYANRAACFLKLNMYDKCLKDIELAKAAGYPEHLMHKLETRQAECLKRLEEGEKSHTIDVKLSFDADKNFPCMANVLKVQKTGDDNFMVVAKQDIDVDQTIVVENVMFPFNAKRRGLMCDICLKRCENFVPCNECAMAIFCPNCEGHFLHKYECGLNFCGESPHNSDMMTEVRTTLLTINMFATADELMEFVERIRNGPKTMPTKLNDDRTKYQAVLNLTPRSEDTDDTDIPHFFPLMVYPMYQTVLRVPEIRAMFQSRKHLRFLQHLIGQLTVIPIHFTCTGLPPCPEIPDDENDPSIFAHGYHVMDKYFQHSCYPNVVNILANGQNVLVTARPIKKGEQLFQSWGFIYAEPAKERQKLLLAHWGKTCVCSRCKGIRASSEQRQQLSFEPAYRFGSYRKWGSSRVFKNSNDGCEKVIRESVMLLQKYGHIEWCDEIQRVLLNYMTALYCRMVGCSQ